jgi:spoIIIJ-associated protein
MMTPEEMNMAADESVATTETGQSPTHTEPETGETAVAAPETAPGTNGEDQPTGSGDEIGDLSLSDEGPAEELPADEAREPVDAAVFARNLLDQILQAMGVPANVTVERQPDGAVRLLVEGEDMGVVIGKHGGTINALQYLVSLILQKQVGERVRIIIDAEGYRSRREQALRDMARAYAQRVKETGQEAVLDALQSYERRVIHNSLADDPDVFTYSEGEEPDRRVVISPRDAEPA